MNGKRQIIGIFLVIVVASVAIWYALTSYKNIQRENHASKVLYGEEENKEKENKEKEKMPWDNDKILVVYFSRSGENYNVGNVRVGNTAMVASYIKEYLDADSYEIEPLKSYPEKYETMVDLALKEKKENARPEIKDKIETLDNYDVIFLGYPIWHEDMPMIIYTFLESHDLTNKTIIPFNTHEGSGNAETYEKIKSLLPESTVNLKGFSIKGSMARSGKGKSLTIEWLEELGYLKEGTKNNK